MVGQNVAPVRFFPLKTAVVNASERRSAVSWHLKLLGILTPKSCESAALAAAQK
jgi:hypothetical protein